MSTVDIVSILKIHYPELPDHNAEHFKLSIDKPSFIRKGMVHHKWKSVDDTQFSVDTCICQTALHISPAHKIKDLINSTILCMGRRACG